MSFATTWSGYFASRTGSRTRSPFRSTLRARKTHQELVTAIERLRTENARLRDEARRLRSDPATIEALARQELGLIKPGEMLFIVKNAAIPNR